MVKPGLDSLSEPYTNYLSDNPDAWPKDILKINDHIGMGYIFIPEKTQEPDATPIPHIYWLMDNYKMYRLYGPFKIKGGQVLGQKLIYGDSGWVLPNIETLKVSKDNTLKNKGQVIALEGKGIISGETITPSLEERNSVKETSVEISKLPMITTIEWVNERLGLGYCIKSFGDDEYIVYWPLKDNKVLIARGPFYFRDESRMKVVTRGYRVIQN